MFILRVLMLPLYPAIFCYFFFKLFFLLFNLLCKFDVYREIFYPNYYRKLSLEQSIEWFINFDYFVS